MKIITLLSILFSSFAFCQENSDNTKTKETYSSVKQDNNIEEKPVFKSGMSEFYKFISKNYRVPVEGLRGKILILFVVDKDGSLTDFKILKDLGYGTGEEAIRVLKACPKWKPGMQKGVPVRVQYTLPINI